VVLHVKVERTDKEVAINFTPKPIKDSLGARTGWDLVEGDHLHKAWTFKNFSSALDWVRHAGDICEKQGHHADFKLGWAYAEATTYTHEAEGLTWADIDLAIELFSIDSENMS